MSRPKKNKVDYFPIPAKDGARMFVMEQKFGDKGYCCYYKLLQLLAGTDNHVVDFSKAEKLMYFVAILRSTSDQVIEMIDTLATLGAIDRELWDQQRKVWCQEFVDSIAVVYTNRKSPVPTNPLGGKKPQSKPATQQLKLDEPPPTPQPVLSPSSTNELLVKLKSKWNTASADELRNELWAYWQTDKQRELKAIQISSRVRMEQMEELAKHFIMLQIGAGLDEKGPKELLDHFSKWLPIKGRDLVREWIGKGINGFDKYRKPGT